MKKPSPPVDLWAQMDAATGMEQREQMDGITAMEYAERHGVASDTARVRLEKAHKQGKLIQGWRRTQYHWVRVYRPK